MDGLVEVYGLCFPLGILDRGRGYCGWLDTGEKSFFHALDAMKKYDFSIKHLEIFSLKN